MEEDSGGKGKGIHWDSPQLFAVVPISKPLRWAHYLFYFTLYSLYLAIVT